MTTQNTQNENNNGLYFIVGALFVAIVIMGVMFVAEEDVTMLEPSAGVETQRDNTPDSTSEFNFEIDDNGVSGSSSTQNDQ